MGNHLKLLFLIGFSGLLFGAGPVTEGIRRSNEPMPQFPLQPGDIVLRTGKGFISKMFRNASRNERLYSHAGIVVNYRGRFMVAHCIQDENGNGGIRLDSPGSFCDPELNTGFSVYRYPFMSGNESRMNRFVLDACAKRIPFDEHFQLDTDGSYYCSEFIFKTVKYATGKELPVTEINGLKYVAIDNLYLNTRAYCVYKRDQFQVK
jgi:hypothetical protein